MPRECIPQHELVWLYAKPQQSAPDNCCRRFGKPVWTFLRFAGAPRIDAEEIVRFKLELFVSSEQQPLRGHWDSAEVTAAITNCFSDHCEFYLAEPLMKISAQLVSPYSRSVPADVVLLIDFPPRIEHRAGGRFF